MLKIEIPKFCPCCASTLEIINEQLFCRNVCCGAQLNKKLEHFTKVLGIKGLGPKTIEKLNLSNLMEIFYIDKDYLVECTGSDRLSDKLLEEIDKSKQADLSTVLAAFSIPLVGNTAAKKIAAVVSSIDDITSETCISAGLGDKVTSNLLNWVSLDYLEIKEFLPFSFKSNQDKNIACKNNISICITGKLSSYKTKAEATKVLETLNLSIVDSVTKSLTYLVDESNKESAKRKKAEEYGVIIITDLNDFVSNFNKEKIK